MAVKTHLDLEVPGGADKVLLHACCAPCSSAILECMLQHDITPVIFYSNSNIYPYEEYDHRRTECVRYAEKLGVEMVEDEYDHEAWLQAVKGLEGEPERGGRCLQCFRFRLRRAAQYAREHGYTVLTTTLASSRWKNLAQINEAGSQVCEIGNGSHQVTWWDQNWRKGGLQERRGEIIREMDFYNQLWCGCEFSIRDTKEEK